MLDSHNKSIPEFAKLIKQCKTLSLAKSLHRQILESTLRSDRFLGNLVVEMYGRCGDLELAKTTFDTLRHPNTFSYNILLNIYARAGDITKAKELLNTIPHPDSISYTTVLSTTFHSESTISFREFFETIPRKDIFAWNVLLAGYARKGYINLVIETFEKMPLVDVISWSTVIQAFVGNESIDRALELFTSIPATDIVCYNIVIRACVETGKLETAQVLFESMPERSLASFHIILGAYAGVTWDNSAYKRAKEIFDQMPERELQSWNSLLTSYVRCDQADQAQQAFERDMPEHDVVSWSVLLGQYARLGHIGLAEVMFARTPVHDLHISNAMLAAYSRLETMDRAELFFSAMPSRGTLSWNTLLGGFARRGLIASAKKLFHEIPEKDIVSYNLLLLALVESRDEESIDQAVAFLLEACPHHDFVSWNTVISGCSRSGRIETARELYDRMPHRNGVSYNAMLSGYGSQGRLEETKLLFDAMPGWDSQSWTAMMNCYSRSGRGGEAIEFFRRLCARGYGSFLDEQNFASVLEACASVSDIASGFDIYCKFVSSGLLWRSEVCCALVDLFGRCGRCELSLEIFQRAFDRSVELWSGMIRALAHSSKQRFLAIEALSGMYLEGLEPDQAVVAAVLSVCCQAGLVAPALQLFARLDDDLSGSSEVTKFQLYHCFINLLARAGRLDEAEMLIQAMPGEPGIAAWTSLLNGCGLQGDADRSDRTGKLALDRRIDRKLRGGALVLFWNARLASR